MTPKKVLYISLLALGSALLLYTGMLYQNKASLSQKTYIPSGYIGEALSLHGLSFNRAALDDLKMSCSRVTDADSKQVTVVPCSNIYSGEKITAALLGTTKFDLNHPRTPGELARISFEIKEQANVPPATAIACTQTATTSLSDTLSRREYVCTKSKSPLQLSIYVDTKKPYPAIWSAVFSDTNKASKSLLSLPVQKKQSRNIFLIEKAHAQDAGDGDGDGDATGSTGDTTSAADASSPCGVCACHDTCPPPYVPPTIHWTSYCTGPGDVNNPNQIWEVSDTNPQQWRNTGGTCPPPPVVHWTQYCTGPNDPNGFNYQIWEYNDQNPQTYRNTGGTCVPATPSGCGPGTLNDTCPAVVWTQYCTGPNDPNGYNYQIWEYDNQSPQTYRNTGGTCVPVAGVCGSTPNSCTAGTLGSNAVQPNGDYHWYCNGTNGGATSPLCWYVAPQNVTWTQYCTGPNDVNGNNYQIWEYSNQNPAVYRNTGGTCVPTPSPTISVTRVPSDAYAGDSFHVVWSTTNATTLGYACTGGFTATDPNERLQADYVDTYQDAWFGTTNCTWTATGPGGTTQLPETFIVRRSVCYPEVCSISTCPPGTFWNGTTCETGCGSNNSCPPVSSNNILLSATPKTLANPGNVTLSFSITSPTTKCAIRAVPYITDDPTHQAARNADASAISSLFSATTTTKTDLNDPYNGPSFSSGRTLSKAFSQADPVTNDGKARGKKTVQVNYSTLFQMSCDNWSTMKSQLVQLTKEKEI